MRKDRIIGHLCGNYPWSSVHHNLIISLEGLGIGAEVYVPFTKNSDKFRREYSSDLVKIIYFKVLKRFIKYFPLTKAIYFSFAMLLVYTKSSIRPKIFISHTLWSDGIVCLFLNLIFKVKYIVCVRNTDLNIFLKYLWIYRPIQKLICSRAENIVFISPALKRHALSKYPYVFASYKNKVLVIPNGVSNDYIGDMYPRNMHIHSGVIKCCFVGGVDSNKNLKSVVDSLAVLYAKGYVVNLDVVGPGIMDIQENNIDIHPWMNIHSYVTESDRLKQIYRNCEILIVPSFYETFGLVYVEAISQGCMAICSKCQGVDGMFDDFNVLYSANPSSLESIANAILKAKLEFPIIKMDEAILKQYLNEEFSWMSVAIKYEHLLNGEILRYES